MTMAVPVRKRGLSIAIVRSRKKHCLNTTIYPGTAGVKEEDELDVTEAAKLSHLSPKTVVTQEALRQAMRVLCCVYKENFRSLRETQMH